MDRIYFFTDGWYWWRSWRNNGKEEEVRLPVRL